MTIRIYRRNVSIFQDAICIRKLIVDCTGQLVPELVYFERGETWLGKIAKRACRNGNGNLFFLGLQTINGNR
jgi:hypothetical protein